MYQSGKTLSSSSASRTEKMFAGLNVALAVVFEAGEPDDLLPAGLPLDDAGRKLVMKGAKDAFEQGGETGLEKFLRDKLGNYADEALNKIGLNNFRSPELLAQHFEKHASEFGYKTIDEYISGARSLVNSSDSILTFTRTNGDQLFYNPVTNEFAALTSDGVIKTFFKPKDGMKYWLKLIGK
jgi:hypothetical protein